MTDAELNEMTDTQYKTYENRMRRMASRQGMRLGKSRLRDPRAIGYGCYWLINDDGNYVVAGNGVNGPSMSLAEIEHCLTTD